MKYVAMRYGKDGNVWTKEADDANEAIKAAQIEWDHLTEEEKKEKVVSLFVLESADSDEEAENHYDGNVVKQWK